MERKSYIDRISSYGFKSAGAVANVHLRFQIEGYGFKVYFAQKNRLALSNRTIIYLNYCCTNFFISCSNRRNTLATKYPSAIAWSRRTLTGMTSLLFSSLYLPQLIIGAKNI